MELSRANFDERLPTLQQAVREADFVAIDTEMTGLARAKWTAGVKNDSVSSRYGRGADAARNMLVPQLGVAAFKVAEDGSVKCKPFCIHLMPAGAQRFVVDASTTRFLLENKFDFNKWVDEGVGYMSVYDYIRRKHRLDKEAAAMAKELRQSGAASMSGRALERLAADRAAILEWLRALPAEHAGQAAPEEDADALERLLCQYPSLTMEARSGYERKLAHDQVQAWFPGLRSFSQSVDGVPHWKKAVRVVLVCDPATAIAAAEEVAVGLEALLEQTLTEARAQRAEELTQEAAEAHAQAAAAAAAAGEAAPVAPAPTTPEAVEAHQLRLPGLEPPTPTTPAQQAAHAAMDGFCALEAGARMEDKRARLEAAVGARRIIDAVRERGCPLVVHNGLLDLLHMHEKMVGPLPVEADEFGRSVLERLAPAVFDTKYMLSRHRYLTGGAPSSLEPAFTAMTAEGFAEQLSQSRHDAAVRRHERQVASGEAEAEAVPAKEPVRSVAVAIEEGFDFGGDGWDAAASVAHNAAYDAWMTGAIFAKGMVALGFDLKDVARVPGGVASEGARAGQVRSLCAPAKDAIPFLHPIARQLQEEAAEKAAAAAGDGAAGEAAVAEAEAEAGATFGEDDLEPVEAIFVRYANKLNLIQMSPGTWRIDQPLDRSDCTGYRDCTLHLSGLSRAVTTDALLDAAAAATGVERASLKRGCVTWVDDKSAFIELPTPELAQAALAASTGGGDAASARQERAAVARKQLESGELPALVERRVRETMEPEVSWLPPLGEAGELQAASPWGWLQVQSYADFLAGPVGSELFRGGCDWQVQAQRDWGRATTPGAKRSRSDDA